MDTAAPGRAADAVPAADPHGRFENLFDGFRLAVHDYPEHPALVVDGTVLTYTELNTRAQRIAHTIRTANRGSACGLVAVLAHRSVTAYSAVLGILGAGRGYVPLHPDFPVERTRRMLEIAGVDTVVVGHEVRPMLGDLLSTVDRRLTVICPDIDDRDPLQASLPQHTFLEAADPKDADADGGGGGPETTAYVLFTSGSTGMPKGVPISQRNVTAYLHHVRSTYDIRPDDRCSQMFDLTFDLSVHDMFLCWTSGACLFCVPQRSVMAPAKFIRDSRLTVWFSVPSVIGFIQRLHLLKTDSFPTLRVSLFCGEPLLAAMADAWQRAAPNSLVENLYGPTEATIAISRFVWGRYAAARGPDGGSTHGVVCIGEVFPTQSACIITAAREPVVPGEPGELCLSGSQITSGYLDDARRTAQQFVTLPGLGHATWYRTGDLVRQSEDGRLHYLGRLDDQVQVRGHRVELQEVDHLLRQATGLDAVALAWPAHTHQVDAIYAFVGTDVTLDTQQVLDYCRRALPEYATPRDLFPIQRIPVNPNGKVDRASLEERLEAILNVPR